MLVLNKSILGLGERKRERERERVQNGMTDVNYR